MAQYQGSSKPIVSNTMRACCLATIELYIREGGIEEDEVLVKCASHPTNSDHRVVMRDGRWRGKMQIKPSSLSA